MCVGLRINERTPWRQSPCWFNRSHGCGVFPWWRRERRASFHRQYLPIHLSVFWSVGSFGAYPLGRGISTHFSHRSGCPIRENHNHQEGIDYLSVSHLCARRWSHWSRTCYHLRTSGCHHCPLQGFDWIGHLSRCRSTRFNFQNAKSSYSWRKVDIGINLGIIKSPEESRNYSKITSHCKISLLFWEWTNFPKKTN